MKLSTLWQPYFDACSLTMVLLTIISLIIPSILPSILRSSLNEYLVSHWNLHTRMNIWYHIQTFMLAWIFGTTLKPWCSHEYLVIPSSLHTRMNIWSHLETLILKWMICMDFSWYACKCNAGPGEMLLMQTRLRSSTKHSCYLFITFNFAWQSTCWAVKLTSL